MSENLGLSPLAPLMLRSLSDPPTPLVAEWYGTDHGDRESEERDNPFVLNLVATIRRLVEQVDREGAFSCREHFQGAISTLGLLGVREADLAEIFHTSATAVNRWFNGRSAPPAMLRALVVRTALELLRRDGFKLFGRRFDAVSGRLLSDAPDGREVRN